MMISHDTGRRNEARESHGGPLLQLFVAPSFHRQRTLAGIRLINACITNPGPELLDSIAQNNL